MVYFFIVILLFFLFSFFLLCTGILLKRKPIEGTCGGLNKVITENGIEYFCETCGKSSIEIKEGKDC